MGIGVSIFLLALGAILTFAVEFDISGLDIRVVGIILMICGLIGLVLALVAMNNGRRAAGPVVEERTYRDDRPTY
ncbi:MAG: DUF6458 family protein [Actinomycetota bacterium]|jgi:hypothetical protein|nr:DUF6458 family protein [Actinomycetota bacterium]